MLKLNQKPQARQKRSHLLQHTGIVRGIGKAALCLGMLVLVNSEALAQRAAFNTIKEDLNRYRTKALQEKLYLHIDRPVYACGETMWFKVYNVEGTLHRLLDMSKIAYVEVLDEAQKPILQAKVSLHQGTGNGSFAIPTTLSSGNYTVRAYTNWMKNFGPEFYFDQPVTIINTFKGLEPAPAPKAAGYTIQFFPEGGNLVAGIANKVAFQAVDQKTGKGVTFEGELQDQQGNKVAELRPHKFGLGHFVFTPASGEKYTATLRTSDNRELKQPLPQVYEQGYTLQLEEADRDQLRITVKQVGEPGDQLYLLGHTRQMVAVAEAATLSQGTATFLVDKHTMADGITHFTVFDARRQPVCERLYFKHPTQKLQVQLAADKRQYNTREKVTLGLQAQLQAAGIEPANLSLAVYRLDSLQGNLSGNIESYLWLTSDLKGTIEQPAYYFTEQGVQDKEAMDNLMLTHGWSRFKWDNITATEPIALSYPPEYNGHWITGKVTHKSSGAPAPGIVTYLASPSRSPRFYNATSDANGLIRYEVKNLYGANDIVVQSNFARDSSYHFEIFNPYSDKYTGSRLAPFHLSETLQQDITQRHLQAQVQHAYFGNYSNRFRPVAADSIPIYGKASEQYLLDNYKRFKVMEEVMREYVPGVQVRRRGGSFRFMVFDRPNKSIFQENPMVLLDGVPVFSIDKIMAFDPLKVKKLDVVTSRFFHGPLMYEGLVSYTTYSGDLAGFELDPKSLLQAYEGLQLQREFYAPDYSTEQQRRSRLADFRNLLHWAPEVLVETGRGTKVDFYTSDQAGTYLVVVQGITATGQPGSAVTTIQVGQSLVMDK